MQVPPPIAAVPSDFKADRIIGVILMVASSFWIAAALLVANAVLLVVCGRGPAKSSKNGLILALIVAVLQLGAGPLGFAIGVGLGLYAILRLWGSVGPRLV